MRFMLITTEKITVANRLTLLDGGSHLRLQLRPGQSLWQNKTTRELVVTENPGHFDSIAEDWIRIDGLPELPVTLMEAICDEQKTA